MKINSHTLYMWNYYYFCW